MKVTNLEVWQHRLASLPVIYERASFQVPLPPCRKTRIFSLDCPVQQNLHRGTFAAVPSLPRLGCFVARSRLPLRLPFSPLEGCPSSPSPFWTGSSYHNKAMDYIEAAEMLIISVSSSTGTILCVFARVMRNVLQSIDYGIMQFDLDHGAKPSETPLKEPPYPGGQAQLAIFHIRWNRVRR